MTVRKHKQAQDQHNDAQPEMSLYEQEELLCTVLTQHLLRHTHTGLPDLKPLWLDI